MKRAIIYARVSTSHQAEEGYSLPTQIEQCRHYAELNGYSVVGVFQDDKSGTTLDREGLNQVRRLVRGGEVDALIVYAPDRFTRKVAHAVLLREELKCHTVELHYVTRGQISDSAEDALIANIEAVFAEYWREKIAEATQRGKRAKVQSGKFPGYGQAPYGYQIAGEKRDARLEVAESEARVVRLIYQWYAYGDEGGVPLTIMQVALKLDSFGIPAPGEGAKKNKVRSPTLWNVTTVHRILRHAVYKGIYYAYRFKTIGKSMVRTSPEDWVAVSVPAIVDETVWSAAQFQMDAQRCESKRNTKYEYLLRGHVRCACGYSATCKTCNSKDHRNGVRYERPFYHCHGQTNRSARPCPYKGTSFSAKKVDPVVWQWIATTLLDEQAIVDGYNNLYQHSQSEVAMLENQRAVFARQYQETQQQLERLLDLYLSGGFDKAILEQRKEVLEKTLNTLKEELSTVDAALLEQTGSEDDLAALLAFAGQVKSNVTDLTFEYKRHLVEILNVRATLTVEDGMPIVYVVSRIDRARLPIDSNGNGSTNLNSYSATSGSTKNSDFGSQASRR
jgi:site-specific DNA recombinase